MHEKQPPASVPEETEIEIRAHLALLTRLPGFLRSLPTVDQVTGEKWQEQAELLIAVQRVGQQSYMIRKDIFFEIDGIYVEYLSGNAQQVKEAQALLEANFNCITGIIELEMLNRDSVVDVQNFIQRVPALAPSLLTQRSDSADQISRWKRSIDALGQSIAALEKLGGYGNQISK